MPLTRAASVHIILDNFGLGFSCPCLFRYGSGAERCRFLFGFARRALLPPARSFPFVGRVSTFTISGEKTMRQSIVMCVMVMLAMAGWAQTRGQEDILAMLPPSPDATITCASTYTTGNESQ